MANDIQKSIPSNPIKNGTVIVTVKTTGLQENDKLNTSVYNTPEISNIEDKYDDKFNHPRYYTGDTAS